MDKQYDYKATEARLVHEWEGSLPSPSLQKNHGKGKRFSMHLTPPNASGPLHVGNALMLAIQDVLARYHRAQGVPTLWIPGTDHGGYETQVSFEREEEEAGRTVEARRHDMYDRIAGFVQKNNELIVNQIRRMGASVDWERFRFTLDARSLQFVESMFRKMVGDSLIYRSAYMMNYCASCSTMLADIELKEKPISLPLYHIKFPFVDSDDNLTLATTRPEFLYSMTHMLAHPKDARLAPHIGRTLTNPATGNPIEIVASKRRFDPEKPDPILMPFMPSSRKYDFEYAIRNGLPVRNLLDWHGRMVERYPGLTPTEARAQEISRLTKLGAIEHATNHEEVTHLCKKGHGVETVIRMSWFLRLDDSQHPLRQPALEAIRRERLAVIPRWREKGLTDWIGKMHDWPLGRQNVWGIKIPIWYEITDPSLFTVWFFDVSGTRRTGNLGELLSKGHSLEEVLAGLERVYATENAEWTLDKVPGKSYLPETDTFDTWFSSSAWSVMVFDPNVDESLGAFYPADAIVIGHDLLRLSIARKILFGVYLTGRLPFRSVYFHSLLLSKDGQKMSKSLGNATTLDWYLDTYGADVTRLALISYTNPPEDFHFSEERLQFFVEFSRRLWRIGKVSNAAQSFKATTYDAALLSSEDERLLRDVADLGRSVGTSIEKYNLAAAQEKLISFLIRFEERAEQIATQKDNGNSMGAFYRAFGMYLATLHPFLPFMTEELNRVAYPESASLARH